MSKLKGKFNTTPAIEQLAKGMAGLMGRPRTILPVSPENEDAQIAAAEAKRERKKARGW